MTRPLTREEQTIVEANVYLARKFGRHASRVFPWLDSEDLIGAACLGLCHAVQRYRSDRGKLSTIAFLRMRQSVYKLVRLSNPIVTPIYTWEPATLESECVRLARRIRTMKRLDDLSQLAAACPESGTRDDVLDLHDALKRLPSRHREVLVRLVMHEERRDTVAPDFGLTPDSLTNLRTLALQRLRKAMTG